MANQFETTKAVHRRAVRFFWSLLIGGTLISLLGNVAHALLPHIPRIVIQIGAAAVPPIALLVAVHGIALAVRAGATGTVYRWAVGAVAAIGAGAFSMSFLTLQDLAHDIGYTAATAWIFPSIIDTAVAVSTLMLVALGDKPARRARSASVSTTAQTSSPPRANNRAAQGAKTAVTVGVQGTTLHALKRASGSAPAEKGSQPVEGLQQSPQTEPTQNDADVAAKLVATGLTIKPVATVSAVLSAVRRGASINAAANAAGINFRTAQRIVRAAEEYDQRDLAVVS